MSPRQIRRGLLGSIVIVGISLTAYWAGRDPVTRPIGDSPPVSRPDRESRAGETADPIDSAVESSQAVRETVEGEWSKIRIPYRLFGSFQQPIEGARIRVEELESGERLVVFEGLSDDRGFFAFPARRDGRYEVSIVAAGFRAEMIEDEPGRGRVSAPAKLKARLKSKLGAKTRPDQATDQRKLTLTRLHAARIEGYFVTPSRRLFTRAEVFELFPGLEDLEELPYDESEAALPDEHEFHEVRAHQSESELFLTEADRPEQWLGRLYANIDPERAAFTREVPDDFEGAVVLQFQRELVRVAPWKVGDGPLELVVDVPALRGLSTTLEVEVIDAATGDLLSPRAVDAELEISLIRELVNDPLDPWDKWNSEQNSEHPPRPRLRFVDLPKGHYTVVASAEGLGTAYSRLELSPGERESVRLELGRPSRFRVFVEEEGDSPIAADYKVILRSPGGVWLGDADESEASSGKRCLIIDAAAIGEVVIFIRDGYGYGDLVAWRRVQLTSGQNADVTLRAREPAELEYRVGLFPPPIDQPFYPATVHRQLLAPDGTVIDDEVHSPSVDPEGYVTIYASAPPGTYRLILDWGTLRRIEHDVELREGETLRLESHPED